ncbi:MAG: amidohydrolase [candidate division KSB1 bacterium]|nr:amidohydrolase [candidate division KSB1 bacterium]
MKVQCVLFSVLLCVLAAGCRPGADLIVINAKVWTVNQAQPVAEAVAVRGDKIVAVGTTERVAKYQRARTTVIDAAGKLLLPGFNDAHLHFRSGGAALLQVVLDGCRTPEEVQQRVAARVAEVEPGQWVTGRGWDHTLFNKGVWPTRQLLDRVSPDNPVFLTRVDGHVGWANSVALARAGINRDTPNPEGGEIVRDPSTGEPTGILKETAASLVARLIPPLTAEQEREALKKALAEARRLGVTSIQDNSGIGSVRLYREFLDRGELTVRVTEWMDFALASDPAWLLAAKKEHQPFCDGRYIRLGLLKGFVDGTLGSRTAYFFDPYDDDPGNVGMPQIDQEKLTAMVCTADSLGFQVGLHCIGSRANWMALNAFEEAVRRFGVRERRHRLEHAQVLRLADIPRLPELGVLASMQPTHCTSDLRWAEQRIGHERCKGAYAWRRILDVGGRICFGTDWPVEPLDPMRGLYSAVTRRNIESGQPQEGWFPDQRLTIEEAIYLYTLGSAYGEFQEHLKGSIEPGKYADMILLSKDLLSAEPQEILTTEVVLTIVAGKIVYRKE